MEKYIPHKSSEQLPDRIDFLHLHDDGDGLRITVFPFSFKIDMSEQTIEIAFSQTFAYRNLDEGMRMRTYEFMKDVPYVPIYTVEDSSFLRYFHEESQGAFRNFNLVHYYIATENDCIDVLSREEPVITSTAP